MQVHRLFDVSRARRGTWLGWCRNNARETDFGGSRGGSMPGHLI